MLSGTSIYYSPSAQSCTPTAAGTRHHDADAALSRHSVDGVIAAIMQHRSRCVNRHLKEQQTHLHVPPTTPSPPPPLPRTPLLPAHSPLTTHPPTRLFLVAVRLCNYTMPIRDSGTTLDEWESKFRSKAVAPYLTCLREHHLDPALNPMCKLEVGGLQLAISENALLNRYATLSYPHLLLSSASPRGWSGSQSSSRLRFAR